MATFWHRPGFRRWLALCALILGLLAAWRTASQRTRTVQVAWLLTHVEVAAAPGVVLDRSRLVQLSWRVPASPGAHTFIEAQRIDFAAGSAPEATPDRSLLLPADVAEVEVACRFALGPGAEPLRTRGRVALRPTSDGVLTVDIDTCGSRER